MNARVVQGLQKLLRLAGPQGGAAQQPAETPCAQHGGNIPQVHPRSKKRINKMGMGTPSSHNKIHPALPDWESKSRFIVQRPFFPESDFQPVPTKARGPARTPFQIAILQPSVPPRETSGECAPTRERPTPSFPGPESRRAFR